MLDHAILIVVLANLVSKAVHALIPRTWNLLSAINPFIFCLLKTERLSIRYIWEDILKYSRLQAVE